MEGTNTPWAVANVLLLCLLAVIAWFRRYHLRSRRACDEAAEEHHRLRSAEASDHEAALAHARRLHQRELDELHGAADADHERLEKKVLSAQDRIRTLEERVYRALRQDYPSRDRLLAAARRCQLDGVLFTNVRGLARGDEGPFQMQVDHVLVSTAGVVAVENKYWRGVVFEGVTPASVEESWGRLFDDDDCSGEFALQVHRVGDSSPDETHPLQMRLDAGPRAPRRQARRNAMAIHNVLAGLIDGPAPWVVPLVFYSHPKATVHTEPDAWRATGPQSTAIVTSDRELDQFLGRMLARRDRAPVDVRTVGNALVPHASEVTDLGSRR